MIENFNDRITGNIVFMVEEENGAWEYYHNYYFVTENGKAYKCKADKERLSSKNRDQIKEIVESLAAVLLKKVNIEEVNKMLEKSKKTALNSKGYCNGGGFDAGEITLYAFNNSLIIIYQS